MVHTLWSVKGGSGVTVCAAALGALLAKRSGRALLVDLRGDLPATLGLPEPTGPGLRDWSTSAERSAASLERLVVPVGDGLSLLPCGSAGEWPPEASGELVAVLASLPHPVVVDAGTVSGDPSAASAARVGTALADAGTSLMVTRPCYLALRRAVASGATADGVVLVCDVGRSLSRWDVEQILGIPVVATIELDPAITRSVDAGFLVRRPHRSLERALGGVA